MPENTPMKMYYQTINGRQVPVYYPQYWSEELGDWVISSEQNRLPVDAQLTGSNVALKISELEETLSYNRVGNLPAGTSEVLAEIEQPCSLESLMLGANSSSLFIRIQNRRYNGSYDTGMRLVDPAGNYSVPVNPVTLNMIGGENDYWREFKYNPDVGEFAFGMKRSSSFGNGIRITIENNTDEDISVAATCMITKRHKNGGQ